MGRIFHYSPSITSHDAIGFSLTSLHLALIKAGVPSYLVCDKNSKKFSHVSAIVVEDLIALKPNSSDVIIFHYSFLDSNCDTIINLSCKKIIVYHNVTPSHFFRQFGQDWLADVCDQARAQLRMMNGAFDVVVADSGYNASELNDMGFPVPTVVPVFFDEYFYRNSKTANDAFIERRSAGTIDLNFIGRFVPNKRIDNLLRVAALVGKMSGKPANLRVFGKIWERAYYLGLRRLAEDLHIENNVVFEINQPREVLRASLAAADAFVSVSEHEGFMVPLIEAFAVGCPVVALASSAITETCGFGGLIVKEPDLEQIAARIVCVHSDPDLRMALIRAQAERVEDFSTANTLRKWDKILRKFLPHSLVHQ